MCVFVMAVHLFFPLPFDRFRFDAFLLLQLRNDANLRQWFSIDAKSIFNGNCVHIVICLFILLFFSSGGREVGDVDVVMRIQDQNVEYSIYHRKFVFSCLCLWLSLVLFFSIYAAEISQNKSEHKRSFKWFLHRSFEVVELKAAAAAVVAWKFIN